MYSDNMRWVDEVDMHMNFANLKFACTLPRKINAYIHGHAHALCKEKLMHTWC